MTNKTAVGEVRPSQLIYTYGVGSIVDLPKMSVIVTGLEDWSTNPEYVEEVVEDRLLHAVRFHHPQVKKLLKPPFVPDDSLPSNPFNNTAQIGVPVATFPRWLLCPQCRLLARVNSGLFKLKESPFYPDRTVYKHINCSQSKGMPDAIPARFLIACANGHMDDFPWLHFVHHEHKCTGKPILRLKEFGPSGEARYLEVSCDTCTQKRRLSDAFGNENIKNLPKCTGRRPHLRDYEADECDQDIRPMILGASNMWFPVSLSTIVVPNYTGKLEKLVDDLWLKLKNAKNIAVIEFLRASGDLGSQLAEFSDDDIWDIIQQRHSKLNSAEEEKNGTAVDLKAPEWDVFGESDPAMNTSDFTLKPVDLGDKWQYSVIEKVTVVERLRETRALIGFTRIDSPGEFSDPKAKISIEPAPLARKALSWVPVDDVRGEGIFIKFREQDITDWENSTEIQKYADRFFQAHLNWRKMRMIKPIDEGFPGMRYVLLHSFSHILMRQLALESGYSMASLRERIYSRNQIDEHGPMAGILIYTSASDSEGTLGGLASLGQADTLGIHIEQALEEAYLCASDPLCAENLPGQDSRVIHGAACHACLFAPETSCERGNKYLDRSVLVPTLEQEHLAYFR